MANKAHMPSVGEILLNMVRRMIFQTCLIGTMLVVFLFPAYKWACTHLCEVLGNYCSEKLVFAILLSLSHTLTYVIVNGSFGLMDRYGWLQQYKLPRKQYMKPKSELIMNTLFEAAIGQFGTSPLLTYFLYPLFLYFGMTTINSDLPAWPQIAFTLIMAHVHNDVGFYVAHRTLHIKELYGRFHKQHHEYAGTMGLAAEYAHPLEQIFANIIPSIGGVLIFGCHPLCVIVWLTMRLQQTYEAHSGYCFKNTLLDRLWLTHADDAAYHDFHHTVNMGNFGAEYLDWACGTMTAYVAEGYHEGYIKKDLDKSS